MMLLGEQAQFVHRISYKLTRFKQINRFSWNFRCPFCGDSRKRQSKARGYLYTWHDSIFFNCFNCNVSLPLKKFLEQVDPDLHKEYCMNKFKPSKAKPPEMDNFKNKGGENESVIAMAGLKKVSELDDSHSAVRYLRSRKIPSKIYKSLYYVPDYGSWAGLTGGKTESRIIIPFKDHNRRLVLTQGRLLMGGEGGSPKYLTRRFLDDALGFFGLDKADVSDRIYLVEGPIDAMLLKNSVAVAGSGLLPAAYKLIDDTNITKDDLTLVYDNEPHNSQIIDNMLKSLDAGFSICVWPNTINGFKDINDLVKLGYDPKKVIDTNTFRGLTGKVKISGWGRIKKHRNNGFLYDPSHAIK